MQEVDAWKVLLEERFPMATTDRCGSLEFVDGMVSEDGERLRAVIRLVRFETQPDGERSLRDIKEQEVGFGHVEHLRYLDRYGEFLAALGDAFATLTGDVVSYAMPVDCVPADVLDLRIATRQEFLEAMMVKSRLGGFIDEANNREAPNF